MKVSTHTLNLYITVTNSFAGEGHFADESNKPSGAATPVSTPETPEPKRGPGSRGGKGVSKKAKTAKQRLAIIDAEGDLGMGGGMWEVVWCQTEASISGSGRHAQNIHIIVFV